MMRLSVILALSSAGLVLGPATASAQFRPGYPNYGGPVIVPSFNPFYYVPQYRYQSSTYLNVPTMYGSATFFSNRYYYGTTNPAYALSNAYPALYAQGGSYSSGGASVRPNLAL